MNDYNGNPGKGKETAVIAARLLEYLIRQGKMKKRITGRSIEFCRYKGTYYCVQDSEQLITLDVGDHFPYAVIKVDKTKPGGNQIKRVGWVLSEEESPYDMRAIGQAALLIVLFAAALFLIVLAIRLPWMIG